MGVAQAQASAANLGVNAWNPAYHRDPARFDVIITASSISCSVVRGEHDTLPLQIKLSAIGDTYVHKDRFDRLCDKLLREISTALQDLHVYRIHGGEFQEISIVISDVHRKRYETFPLPNGFTYQPQQNKAIQLLVEVADHVQYKELQVPSLGLELVGIQ